MQTIYLDVLTALNLLLTWAMLYCTAELTHRQKKRGRMLLGSLLGGIASLIMILPQLPLFLLFPLRILLAGAIVRVSFGRSEKRAFIRLTLVFFLVSVLFAGTMIALYALISPPGMTIRNGTVYFHISALSLTAAALFGCAAAKLFSLLFEKRLPARLTERFTARAGGRETSLTLLLDTGNRLTSFGKPVAIVRPDALKGFFPESLLACANDLTSALALSGGWKEKLRMVPCGTAAGKRLLPGIPVALSRERDGAVFDCILALGSKDFSTGADAQEIDGVIGVLE